jgi:hypothetical protein
MAPVWQLLGAIVTRKLIWIPAPFVERTPVFTGTNISLDGTFSLTYLRKLNRPASQKVILKSAVKLWACRSLDYVVASVCCFILVYTTWPTLATGRLQFIILWYKIVLEELIFILLVKKYPIFGWSLRSQNPAIGSCSHLIESRTHPLSYSVPSLILWWTQNNCELR